MNDAFCCPFSKILKKKEKKNYQPQPQHHLAT